MKDRVCPVCGNPEVGDYRHEHLTCERCGSDLGIFQMLEKEKSHRTHRLVWVAIGMLCALIVVSFVTAKITLRKNLMVIIEKEDIIATQQHRIQELEAVVTLFQSNNETNNVIERGGEFLYSVRKGDSFCSISRKLYGTEKYYKEIAENNGISITSHLTVGQQLKIKTR